MTGRSKDSTFAARASEMGLFDNRVTGRRVLLANTVVRIVGGLLFVASAIPKITAHQNGVDMFASFGLPRSSTLVYLVTALEISCGLLLLLGLLTRLAAAAMAADMTGAILTAGIHVGGPIHLGLAPTLLAAMLYLIWTGPGLAALDRKWARPTNISMTPPPTRITVVGAALIVDGRLLAARRRRPPSLAGYWELPGGKVEPSENEASALARELREELTIQATIGPELGRTSINPAMTLDIYLCTHFTGVPTLGDDHDDLRWVYADNLADVDWLAADRLLLPAVIAHLTPSP